jgi:hypothetical protein
MAAGLRWLARQCKYRPGSSSLDLERLDKDSEYLETIHGSPLRFDGRWQDKNWLNVPGPFYGAMTDTCGCGPFEAPQNVLMDEDTSEFIYRQPRNERELRAVLRVNMDRPV